MTDHPIPRMPIRASPYAHQQAAYEKAMRLFSGDPTQQNLGIACLMEMGTGKSLVAIATAGAMYQSGHVRRLLVVCPKTIMGVWKDEFAKFADFNYELTTLTGPSDDKAKRLKELSAAGRDGQTAAGKKSPLQAVVINYESAWRLESALIKWQPDMIVADEGHKLKTPNTRVSKSMHRLGAVANYKMLLTGTPVTNKPLDVFSQYKFTDVGVFGPNFYAFRNRYFDMVGFGGYEPVLKKSCEDEFTRRIHSIAFRATKAECLDLPETIDVMHHVDLEPSAAKIYRNLAKDSWTELQSLASGDRPTITATNVLTRLLRLSQCAGGFVTDDEGGVRRVSTAKLEALEELIEAKADAGEKTVVIARFTPEIDAICRMLNHRGVTFSLVQGSTTDRDEQVRAFQTDPSVMVFVGQIATAGLGITLTAASTLVFFSLDYSMANFEQAKARIHRVGQTRACTYIYLTARGTVDEKVLAALRDKSDIAKALIDDCRAGKNPFE